MCHRCDESITIVTISERIQILRGGKSRAGFAKECGISRPALVNYEEGRIPGTEEAIKIAAATSVTIDWLLTSEGPMRRGEEEVPNAAGGGATYGVPGGLSAFEAKLIALFRRLLPHKQKRFPGLVAFLADEEASDFMQEIKELEEELKKVTG